MMHRNRRHRIKELATLEELADKLTNYSWTVCCGFRVGDLILLNDATSEDGAQEFAVIRDGRQIESLTASWMKEARMLEVQSGSGVRHGGGYGEAARPGIL